MRYCVSLTHLHLNLHLNLHLHLQVYLQVHLQVHLHYHLDWVASSYKVLVNLEDTVRLSKHTNRLEPFVKMDGA